MHALLLALAALSLPAVAQTNPADFVKERTSAGTLIQDPDAPVSLRLPAGWELIQATRWGDHETTLSFRQRASALVVSFYYQHPLNPPVTVDAETALRQGIDGKVKQRQERESIPDYRVRSGSVRKQEIGGMPAMSYIGDFTMRGEPQQEYMLRILGKNTKAHFFLMLPAAADLEGALRKLEPIAASLKIQ